MITSYTVSLFIFIFIFQAEFAKLYFTGDWPTVKSAFLKLYSRSFYRNKKRELKIDFDEHDSIRSFVERKLTALSKFTSMPLINQMEVILNDLPEEISSLFITEEKMTCGKTELLDFCESIQDLVQPMVNSTEANTSNNVERPSNPSNRMEIFNFTRDSESSDTRSGSGSMAIDEYISPEPQSSRGRGSGRGRGHGKRTATLSVTKSGRPKKLKPIIEDAEHSSEYDFLNQVDDTSRSTWSDNF